MAIYIVENIIKQFALDTFICSMNGTDLKGHMKKKHGWNDKTFIEFMEVYRSKFLCGTKRIKFVYYKGYTCKVVNERKDGSVYVSCEAAIPAYMFELQKSEYTIAAYWPD